MSVVLWGAGAIDDAMPGFDGKCILCLDLPY